MSALIKTKVVVLILDDDRSRDPVYRRFFEKIAAARGTAAYEVVVEIPATPSAAIGAIDAKCGDLIVLDMIFSEIQWAAGREALLNAVERSELPLALISVDFNDAHAVRAAQQILRLPNKALGFFAYALSIGFCDHGDDEILATEAQIWTNLLSYARELNLSWEPVKAGCLTLLHLTDTHLGLTQTDDLDVADMATCAARAGRQADCIAWSGDITQSGFPDEFERAHTFLGQLQDQKLVSWQAPVFMVPGNLDLPRFSGRVFG
jgi:hypothetical protein